MCFYTKLVFSRICFTLLLAFVTFTGFAQNPNPAYDEWQRKERLKDSLRKSGTVVADDFLIMNEAFDLTAGVGVIAGTGGLYLHGSPSWSSKGQISTSGIGVFYNISLGNLYSPQLGKAKVGLLYGACFKIGSTYGGGVIDYYAHGINGLSGGSSVEDYNNISDRPNFTLRSSSRIFSITGHLGFKVALAKNITAGMHGGVGIGALNTSAYISYLKSNTDGSTTPVNLWAEVGGPGLCAHLEAYVSMFSFFYAGVAADHSGGGWPGGVNPLVSKAVRLQVGVRLPLLNFGSSLRALKP